MSKSSKKTKKNLPNSKNEESPISSPIIDGKDGNVKIIIHAKPGAKFNQITDITPEAVDVAISAPPVEGEANTELIKYLASLLGVRKSDISLDKGSRSRQKIVSVTNNTASQILQKLQEEKKVPS
ncbi:UPF0235 protein C15orf40 isoform X2 [Chelonus insularis]|nr:UPF0235 protein C15orf40 isoform X2 [Chelonus insularis]